MSIVALIAGLLIAAVGVLGIADPALLMRTVHGFQTLPAIYGAAIFRIAVGAVLVRAAPASRTPRTLRVLGFVILIAGILTPFVGVQGARAVLDWWSRGGPALIRAFASLALVVGLFIVYSVTNRRRDARP